MSESITEAEVARDQGRDLMADIIDAYMKRGGEGRAYDLADRLMTKLNQSGWWFVHGGDVERMISQEHPFNAKLDAKDARIQELTEALREARKRVVGLHIPAFLDGRVTDAIAAIDRVLEGTE